MKVKLFQGFDVNEIYTAWTVPVCVAAALFASTSTAVAQNRPDPVCSTLDQAAIAAAPTGDGVMVLGEHDDRLTRMTLTPGGDRLLSWGADGTARIWDVGSAREYRRFSTGGEVLAAELSPDESLIVLETRPDGTRNRSVSVWDVESGEKLHQTTGNILGLSAFMTDDRLVVRDPGDMDGTDEHTITVRLIDLVTGEVLAEFEPANPRGEQSRSHGVRRAVLSPSGERLLTVDSDDVARLWNGETGAFIAHLSETGAAFTPNGDRVLNWPDTRSATRRGRIQLWDVETGAAIPGAFPDDVSTLADQLMAYSSDGRTLIVRSNGSPTFWRVEDGVRIGAPVEQDGVAVGAYPLAGTDRAVVSTRLRQAGRETYVAQLFDTGLGAPLGGQHAFRDIVLGVQMSPDGQQIAVRSRDGTVLLIDAETGDTTVPRLTMSGAVTDTFFLADSPGLLTASLNGTVRLWSLETGTLVGPPTLTDLSIQEMYWVSAHNRIILERYGFRNGTIYMYDMSWAAGPWETLLACHSASASRSPDERREALVADDAEFRALTEYVSGLARSERPDTVGDTRPETRESLALGAQPSADSSTFPPDFEQRSFDFYPVDSIYFAATQTGEGAVYRSVFWAFVGSIRMRAHIDCRGAGPGAGDYALNAVVRQSIATPIVAQLQGEQEVQGAILGLALDWYGDQYDPAAPMPYCETARAAVLEQNRQSEELFYRYADE